MIEGSYHSINQSVFFAKRVGGLAIPLLIITVLDWKKTLASRKRLPLWRRSRRPVLTGMAEKYPARGYGKGWHSTPILMHLHVPHACSSCSDARVCKVPSVECMHRNPMHRLQSLFCTVAEMDLAKKLDSLIA